MDRTHDGLDLRISETAADRLCARMLRGSGFARQHEYEYSAGGLTSIRSRLELRESRLRFRQADDGAVRFDVSVRFEFDPGFPYPSRRTDLVCAVLIKPVLRRLPDGRLVVSADFARAALRGVRVRSRARGGMVGFDTSAFDALSDEPLREMARFGLRAALKRMGAREGIVSHAVLIRLLDAAGSEDELAFEVRNGEARMIAGQAKTPSPANHPALPDGRSAEFRISEAVVTRLLRLWAAEGAGSGRFEFEPIAVDLGAKRIEVVAAILPAAFEWPFSWRPRLRADLSIRVENAMLELRVAQVHVTGITRFEWARRLVLRAVRDKLDSLARPAAVTVPTPTSRSDTWQLEIVGVEIEDRRLAFLLRADL